MVARGGFEPPQAASKAAVLTITQPGNQKKNGVHYSICSLKYPYVFIGSFQQAGKAAAPPYAEQAGRGSVTHYEKWFGTLAQSAVK